MATETEILEYHPLKQEKIAQDMAAAERDRKILFSIVTPLGAAECVWVDPYLGLFQIKGKGACKKCVFMTHDLPEGTIIFGTRYED